MQGTSYNFILASGTIKTKCLIRLMVLCFQIERHQILREALSFEGLIDLLPLTSPPYPPDHPFSLSRPTPCQFVEPTLGGQPHGSRVWSLSRRARAFNKASLAWKAGTGLLWRSRRSSRIFKSFAGDATSNCSLILVFWSTLEVTPLFPKEERKEESSLSISSAVGPGGRRVKSKSSWAFEEPSSPAHSACSTNHSEQRSRRQHRVEMVQVIPGTHEFLHLLQWKCHKARTKIRETKTKTKTSNNRRSSWMFKSKSNTK